MAAKKQLKKRSVPVHPGEMLRDEFMAPMGLSANALAIALRVPATRISDIVRERRAITADTAFRLSIYFDVTPEFWLNAQKQYELSLVEGSTLAQIKKEVQPRKAVSGKP